MSLNYLSYVSWGVYGGTTQLSKAAQAHYFASWGIMQTLGGAVTNWLTRWYWWGWYYGLRPWQ